MKVTIKLTSIILILFLFSNCGSNPAELIVGKWKISDVKTTSEIPKEQKEAFDNAINDMKANSFLEIKSDKKFTKNNNGEVFNGTWDISEDGKKLTLTYDKTKEVSQINELTSSRLSISIDVNDEKNTIIYSKAD